MRKLWLLVAAMLVLSVSGCAHLSISSNIPNYPAPPRPVAVAEENPVKMEELGVIATDSLPVEVPVETALPTTITPSPTPEVKEITISLVGDCTFGEQKGLSGDSSSFTQVVGSNYEYPLKNAAEIFSRDDLTLVNLEGALTDVTTAQDKEFVFKGKPDFVKILTLGSVEAVNLGNNHAGDYGTQGLSDTKTILDQAGILWSVNQDYAIYEAQGVKIGMAGFSFPGDSEPIFGAIDSLRQAGCDIVIISVHAGTEAKYTADPYVESLAHDIIDYGADIYVGHHPHRLQPIEEYNGKYILYSLSNFSFGGQPYLTDPDTAIVQCNFTVDEHNVINNQLHVIPYSMTTVMPGNDYCPKSYEINSPEYGRVLKKLNWSLDKEY